MLLLLCLGDRLTKLLGLGADLAAGRDSSVVLLCAGHQGGVLGGLLLCVLVSFGELLPCELGGLLGLRLAGSLVSVGLGGPDVL